jgi:archaeal flagellin FlaB
MKNLSKIMKKDVGSIGIGAMIVFIAMVLVAGIAASVLIQTSTKLETQAMATGSETTAEVASGIAVFDVLGYAASGSDISKILIGVRPRAGSDGIDLSTAFVEISDSTTKVLLTYNSSYYLDPGTDGLNDMFGDDTLFPTGDTSLSATDFGILVVEDADDSLSSSAPVMNRGDKVYLCINTTATHSDFEERVDIWGIVVPEEGAQGMITFTTPASYTNNVMDLQ